MLSSLRHCSFVPVALIKRTLHKLNNSNLRISDKILKNMCSYSSGANDLLPKTMIVEPVNCHSATLFLFHGSGDNGNNFKQWIDILNRNELRFPHIKIIYVTAPLQSYTPNGGLSSNVWFDRAAISIHAHEVLESIDSMLSKISDLINKEVEEGIPIHRIAVGGFSMGGCLALHLAYRMNRSLAGCLAMSSFINENSSIYSTLKSLDTTKDVNWPKLLQFHGTADKIVPIQWGQNSFDNIHRLGVSGNFVLLPRAEHEIVTSELTHIKLWLSTILPANEISCTG